MADRTGRMSMIPRIAVAVNRFMMYSLPG